MITRNGLLCWKRSCECTFILWLGKNEVSLFYVLQYHSLIPNVEFALTDSLILNILVHKMLFQFTKLSDGPLPPHRHSLLFVLFSQFLTFPSKQEFFKCKCCCLILLYISQIWLATLVFQSYLQFKPSLKQSFQKRGSTIAELDHYTLQHPLKQMSVSISSIVTDSSK